MSQFKLVLIGTNSIGTMSLNLQVFFLNSSLTRKILNIFIFINFWFFVTSWEFNIFTFNHLVIFLPIFWTAIDAFSSRIVEGFSSVFEKVNSGTQTFSLSDGRKLFRLMSSLRFLNWSLVSNHFRTKINWTWK